MKHPNIEVNIKYANDITPLHYAQELDGNEMTKELLGHADTEVNAVNKFGDTPLHMMPSSIAHFQAES